VWVADLLLRSVLSANAAAISAAILKELCNLTDGSPAHCEDMMSLSSEPRDARLLKFISFAAAR
jgi:hypothetical protein